MEAARAVAVLDSISSLPGHEFWPDDVGYDSVDLRGVLGHRQLADAYLAQLARNRSGTLATLDAGLATVHSDTVVLVPGD